MQPLTTLVIGTIFEQDNRPVDDRRRMIHEWRETRRRHVTLTRRSAHPGGRDEFGGPTARGDVRA